MTWAVVVAAGRGLRFGGQIPKQFVPVLGKPLLQHALERLASCPSVEGMVVVLPAEATAPLPVEMRGKPMRRAGGGAERVDSVSNGLAALPADLEQDAFVLVHDGARPCVRVADIERLIERGSGHDAGALLAVPVRDTLKRADGDSRVAATLPRHQIWRAQTPQLFRVRLLREALALSGGPEITDEAAAVEAMGLKPLLVPGSEDNIKVTTASDLLMAEWILSCQGALP
ncbi:MAG TPA: 2-C-methyl-D-erythritol 4-phosphate cytidylyltransferase [Xanthomonadaceae bacterium]|nr:2-C-methyl-D-erythritol 4-phosphate cytidylyltransferase [Xanthomonadaceae bacterium]